MKNLKCHAQECGFYLLGSVAQLKNFQREMIDQIRLVDLEILLEWFVCYGCNENGHES